MKRLTFTLLTFFLFSFTLFSQTIETCKWLEDEAEWYYTPWSMTSIPTLVKVEIVDEVLIGDRNCSVLGVIIDDELIEESRLIVFYDRALEQVFFYENEEWKLILDFSSDIKVGDIIEYYLPQNFEYYDISSTSGEFTVSENAYKSQVVEIETINNPSGAITKAISFGMSVGDNDEECFSLGPILNGIGSNVGLFGHNCTQLTAGFGEYLRCFKSKSISYFPEEDCNPPGLKWLGEEGAEWTHCLLPELFDPYTVDITTRVVDFYKENSKYYAWITGNFFSHTYNSEIDSVLIINDGDQVYYSFNGEAHLLYDFDVEPGDTLFLRFPVELEPTWFDENPNVSTTFRLLIESTEHVFVDNRLLKRIHFKELREVDPITGDHIWAPTDLGGYYTQKLGYRNFIFPYVVTGYDENNVSCDLREYADQQFEFENEDNNCLILSTNDFQEPQSLVLAPNPASGIVSVSLSESAIESIHVYATNGEEMIRSTTNKLDVTYLLPGIYFVRLVRRDGMIESGRFVKVE